MAIAVTNSGSLTLTTGEQTLGAVRTDGKTYVCALDLNTMAAGDVVELYIYVKTLTGSTARLLFKQVFANAQGDPNFQTVPIPAPYSVEFKLKQPTGTLRTIDYALMSLD